METMKTAPWPTKWLDNETRVNEKPLLVADTIHWRFIEEHKAGSRDTIKLFEKIQTEMRENTPNSFIIRDNDKDTVLGLIVPMEFLKYAAAQMKDDKGAFLSFESWNSFKGSTSQYYMHKKEPFSWKIKRNMHDNKGIGILSIGQIKAMQKKGLLPDDLEKLTQSGLSDIFQYQTMSSFTLLQREMNDLGFFDVDENNPNLFSHEADGYQFRISPLSEHPNPDFSGATIINSELLLKNPEIMLGFFKDSNDSYAPLYGKEKQDSKENTLIGVLQKRKISQEFTSVPHPTQKKDEPAIAPTEEIKTASPPKTIEEPTSKQAETSITMATKRTPSPSIQPITIEKTDLAPMAESPTTEQAIESPPTPKETSIEVKKIEQKPLTEAFPSIPESEQKLALLLLNAYKDAINNGKKLMFTENAEDMATVITSEALIEALQDPQIIEIISNPEAVSALKMLMNLKPG